MRDVATVWSGAPKPIEDALAAIRSYGWEDLGWSVAVVGAAYLIGRLGASAATRFFGRWASRTQSAIDDVVLEKVRRPFSMLVPIVVVRAAISITSLPEGTRAWLQHVLLVLGIAAGGWLVQRVISIVDVVVRGNLDLSAADNLRARQLATSTRGILNIASFAVFILTISIIMMTFDSVRQIGSTLLASAGVAGLVIGFAAQKSIATVLAGIQIAITQPIRVDDVVIVEGEWGRIEEITLTYVVVRIWDLRRLIVPIGHFIDQPFQNWTRVSGELLGTVELHVDYGVPVHEIRDEFERILAASDKWDGKVKSVQVTASTDKTMTVRPLFSAANSSDQWNLRCEVREKLLAFLREHHPYALPRLRAEVPSADVRRAGAQPSLGSVS